MPGPNPDPPPEGIDPYFPDEAKAKMEKLADKAAAENQKSVEAQMIAEKERQLHRDIFRQEWQRGWVPTKRTPVPEEDDGRVFLITIDHKDTDADPATAVWDGQGDPYAGPYKILAWRELPPAYEPDDTGPKHTAKDHG